MKKLLLFSTLLVGSSMVGHAQGSRFGIKAGGSYTTFVGKDVDSDINNRLGYHGGLIAELSVTDRFSIQPELLYSMKGAQTKYSFNGSTVTGTQTMHYVDVPVLAKAKLGQLFLEAGPQVGVLMSAKASYESNKMSFNVSNKSSFNDVDFGYALGLGSETSSGLLLGLRYNGGFRDVTKAESFGALTIQPRARNSAFQVYVGYMFGGK
ncbi:porin family protein [Hymenobacter arizonensis]|uniref:Outer membrane protein beta-barrel domain-containing protein n=1 Tax=Hymenobacter arizonensis TaxID=1227077 RepID=A0A1I5YBE3_HYMAR|nr:porin family protein [Hymenobacter arizonensis]SFQ41545.1 Outer membrane protein beta-barrel domain-containing protein [Hymenobacter arizonensis]